MKITANGFITELPPQWEDRSMITFVGPTGESGFAANVVITRERVPANTKVEDYAQEQRRIMETEIPGIEILDERPTQLNNIVAFQRLQKFTLEGQDVQQVQTFVQADKCIFSITCSCSVNDFEQNLSAFRQITSGFHLTAPAANLET